jgi:GDP-D-mannose dehydratase
MTKKKALITGVTGQDGSYLADLLLRRLRGLRIIAGCDAEPHVSLIVDRIQMVQGPD